MLDFISKIVGFLYLLKLFVTTSAYTLDILWNFAFPKLWNTQGDFKTRFGTWAMVTGCTSGIGKAFARQLAEKGLNIILVSRSKSKLEMMAEELEREFAVLTKIIVTDFKQIDQITTIGPTINKENLDLGVVVNNVGYADDHSMPFLTQSRENMIDMITINCQSATVLCRDLLPSMTTRGRGAVINVSSMASCLALPMAAVYCGSKHYISALTKSLQIELKDSGVIIQDLIPGMVRTEMTKSSHSQVPLDRPLMPSAEDYVRSALATIGNSKRTTGWWPHYLRTIQLSLMPERLVEFATNLRMTNNYQRIMQEKMNKDD